MNKCTLLKQLLDAPEILVMPGAYDALSAKIIEKTGFKAVQCSGYGFSASLLGKPDIGLLSFEEVLIHTKNIVNAVDIPVMADGDTGYGNAINVIRTVREFEKIGAAGINIEDQIWPKRCGHMAGKEIISTEEMVKKIEAAVWARKNPDFIINARTDAIAVYGLEEAIKRAEAYWNAGADLIFVEAPNSIKQLKEITSRLVPKGVRLSVNMLDGGRTPLLTFDELQKMGFKRVSIPVLSIYVVAKALQDAMHKLLVDRTNKYLEDRIMLFSEFNKLVGLPEIRELEARFLPADKISVKYGSDAGLKSAIKEGR